MSQSETTTKGARIEIENVGGIDRASESFEEGVTILAGRNATNRTSFLQGIMAATGSDRASLKADASEGRVELELDGETYTRRMIRSNGHVRFEGSPYLEDSETADLFSFLIESNECRRAVRGGEDLQEIIMRPIDTEALEREIRQLEQERNRVDEELSRLDRLERQLPELEEQKQATEAEIESLETEVAEMQDAVAEIDEEAQEQTDTDGMLDRLKELRQERNRAKHRLAGQRESIEALEAELEEASEALADHEGVSVDRREDIEGEIRRKRARIDRLEESINKLDSIIRFNEEVLEGEQVEWIDALSSDEGDLTDQLLATDTRVCWTCGSEISGEAIESTLDTLRSVRRSAAEERNAVSKEVDELQAELRDFESRAREIRQLEQTIERTETDIEDRRDRRSDLEDRVSELDDEIESFEQEIEEHREEHRGDLLDRHAELTNLEYELESRRDDLANLEDRIETLEEELGEEEHLEARRDEIADRIAELRTKVENLQREAVEAFNEHMETVLELLDYENLERIWIERKQAGNEIRSRSANNGRFELHIVRSVDDETLYEDTIENLSESEREVTGLIFGLAGYLVHDVYEDVPFMVLDSIETIDADRIGRLVDYLSEYADYLVVALLEEDAAALDDEYPRIASIGAAND